MAARRPEGVFIDQGAAAGLERVQCVVRGCRAARVPSVFCVGERACVLCACYVVVGGGGARALRMLYSTAVRVRRPNRAAP